MVVVLFSLYPHPIRAMDPLEELAHCFHAHVKEEYQFDLKNFKEYRKEGGIKAEVVETNIKAAKYRNEWARSLKKDVKSYLQKTLTPDAFLRRLLTDRRGYLRERLNNFQLAQLEYQKTGSLLRYFFLATTPGAIKAYIERSTNKEKGIDHYNTVIRIIDRYQIWNKLIVGVFKRHALKEFSSETRDYLRASVTLHPLIRGETEDWGHPDAAMLTYAGDPPGHKVDSYYFSPFGLSSDLPKVPWLELESEKKVSEASTQPPLSKSARRKQERKENPELRLKLKAEAEKYKNNASVFSKTSPLATEAKPAEAFEVALRIEPKSAEAPVVIPSSIVP